MSRTLLDVTRKLVTGTPVWPGDAGVTVESRPMGGGIVSRLATTCHAGTHLETGRHVAPGHPDVASLPLELLVGPAEVVRVPARPAGRVGPADLPRGWRPAAERVLLATDTHPAGSEVAAGRFMGVETALVHLLADAGVRLLGIDTPSVDPLPDGSLAAHRALAERGLVWIEGLDLEGVPAGRYQLVALPLPLPGAEAAPLRAVLVHEEGG